MDGDTQVASHGQITGVIAISAHYHARLTREVRSCVAIARARASLLLVVSGIHTSLM